MTPTTTAPPTHARCVCRGCGEVFSAVSNFSRHRKDGRCLDPATLGMEIKVCQNGTYWGMPGGDYRPRKGDTVPMYRRSRKNGVAALCESETGGD